MFVIDNTFIKYNCIGNCIYKTQNMANYLHSLKYMYILRRGKCNLFVFHICDDRKFYH